MCANLHFEREMCVVAAAAAAACCYFVLLFVQPELLGTKCNNNTAEIKPTKMKITLKMVCAHRCVYTIEYEMYRTK